ncbi:hypothetical protein ABZP36_013684 [Zizania latifolia]
MAAKGVVVEKNKEKRWSAGHGSPLYDSFKLALAYVFLDRHLMTLPFAKWSAVMVTTKARAPARRTAAKAKPKEQRRRKAVAARRTGKAVLRSIFRSVPCSRSL